MIKQRNTDEELRQVLAIADAVIHTLAHTDNVLWSIQSAEDLKGIVYDLQDARKEINRLETLLALPDVLKSPKDKE